MVVAVLAISCGGSSTTSTESTRSSDTESTDVTFVRRMLIEHQHGIDLADIAITRSSYLDLLEFATTISATQASEVEQMQNWLRARGLDAADRSDPGLDPSRSVVSEADRESILAEKGFASDDVWITLMSQHQQRSIDLANLEIDSGSDPTLIELARSIRDSHQSQIDGLARIYVTFG